MPNITRSQILFKKRLRRITQEASLSEPWNSRGRASGPRLLRHQPHNDSPARYTTLVILLRIPNEMSYLGNLHSKFLGQYLERTTSYGLRSAELRLGTWGPSAWYQKYDDTKLSTSFTHVKGPTGLVTKYDCSNHGIAESQWVSSRLRRATKPQNRLGMSFVAPDWL
jgi:hypothetical protein